MTIKPTVRLFRAAKGLNPLMLLALLCACSSSPAAPQAAAGATVTVPARPQDWRTDVLTPTTLEVRAGTTLVFSVSGSWNIGFGLVGPAGRGDWCECVVSRPESSGFRGQVGALIGRIGPNGEPFLIGARSEVRVDEDGTLFLGANDNMGTCDRETRGSCFADNTGRLTVRVETQ